MAETREQSPCSDPIWTAIRAEAWSEEEREAYLSKFLTEVILKSRRLEDALSRILMRKLTTECLSPELLRSSIDRAFAECPTIGPAIRRDLQAVRDRDPTSRGFLMPFLFFKGFQALFRSQHGKGLLENRHRARLRTTRPCRRCAQHPHQRPLPHPA